MRFLLLRQELSAVVKDRAAQYEKEGKVILAQSNDETGKEHYVIYGDPRTQVLGVDTLGDSVKVIPLRKQSYQTLDPVAYSGKGLQMTCDEFVREAEITINSKGEFLRDNTSCMKIVSVFKDKYIVVKNVPEDESLSVSTYIIFFDKKTRLLADEEPTIAENGDITFNIQTNMSSILEYGNLCSPDNNLYDLGLDVQWDMVDFCIKTTITPTGEIKLADYGIASTTQIPTEAFSSLSLLQDYLQEIAKKKEGQKSRQDILNEIKEATCY